MTHAHITTWLIALILFIVAIVLHKNEKKRPYKIVVMILRVFYLLIIVTGGMLLFSLASITGMYWVKAILGLIVIGFLEMVLGLLSKGKPAGFAWILLIVGFIAVVYLGFDLPLGF
jgi:Protein of unknown function (DUF1516)